MEELTATYYTYTNLKSGTKYGGKIVASDDKGATSEILYEFITQWTADSGNDDNSNNNGSEGQSEGILKYRII